MYLKSQYIVPSAGELRPLPVIIRLIVFAMHAMLITAHDSDDGISSMLVRMAFIRQVR